MKQRSRQLELVPQIYAELSNRGAVSFSKGCFAMENAMHDRSFDEPTNEHTASLDCQMTMAERELTAFFTAVTELFGSEHAKLSLEDWLEELQSLDSLPGLRTSDWRQVTVAALSRLAARVNASRPLR